MSQPEHPTPDAPETREGDIDEDRQDPPLPSKTGGDENLDGFTPTPGDNGKGDDD